MTKQEMDTFLSSPAIADEQSSVFGANGKYLQKLPAKIGDGTAMHSVTVYDGPSGKGYIANVWSELDCKSVNFGPEKWMDSNGWQLIIKKGG